MTTNSIKTCPLSKLEVIESYFMEHRAKLIDIAAYLDRVDRASGTSACDFRHEAFRRALNILASDDPHRASRILELFSVTNNELPQSADGMKGAKGAVPLSSEGRS